MTSAAASEAPARGRARDRLYFVGISTSGSLIMKIFPAWVRHLGLNAAVTGVDLPPGSSRDVYRRCADSIAADPDARGALITAHKAALYEAARDMFTSLDHYAVLCREISNMLVRDGERRGLAKDPVTARLALRHMLGPGYWRSSGREAVCFGAGGAGIAILVALLEETVPPARVVLVDSDPRRLEVAREVVRRLDRPSAVELVGQADPARNDALVAAVRPGSLIINATGLGKDRPGSPVTGHVVFPAGSVAWDLNYRGGLDFLRVAERQAAARTVRAHDGWRYFLHGWTDVVADAFGLPLTPQLFTELAGLAALCAPRRAAGRG